MIALKCLHEGGIAPFSRLAWPLPKDGDPGAWLEAEPHACASGIHACLPESLPYWLTGHLWTIELEGVQPAQRKLVARRGRLLERLHTWDDEAMHEFALDCVGRAEEVLARDPSLADYVGDARAAAGSGRAPATGFIVARITELADGPAAYEAERATQARWLADRLGLD